MGPSTGAIAWPWWGRSLPKGNQWECCDPGLGPNMVGLPVHLPPQCIPDTSTSPLYPCWPLTPTFPASPNAPWHPYTPDSPPMLPTAPNALTPLHPQGAPIAPDAAYTPVALSTYTPCQPPMHPWHHYTPRGPQCLLMPPVPLLTPEHLHSLPAPMHPDIPTPHDRPSNTPHTLYQPSISLMPWYPWWPLRAYTSCQLPNASPASPLTPPWHPCTPASVGI